MGKSDFYYNCDDPNLYLWLAMYLFFLKYRLFERSRSLAPRNGEGAKLALASDITSSCINQTRRTFPHTRREESGKTYQISGRNYHKFLVDGDYSDILSNILIKLEKFY